MDNEIRQRYAEELTDVVRLASETAQELVDAITRTNPGLLIEIPVDSYIAPFDAAEVYGNYGFVPDAVASRRSMIECQGGQQLVDNYHKLLLMTLIGGFPGRASIVNLPDTVLDEVARTFTRIVYDVRRNPAGFYKFDNDLFAKDLGVCRLKLIPCGAFLVDRWAGMPRSSLARGNFTQAVKFAMFVAARLGGFKPLYELHMDKRLVLRFNREEWRQCYQRVGQLVAANPGIKGVMGACWWYDPVLADFSPGLVPLRSLAEENGARVFDLGHDAASTGNATANSAQRKKLFEDGKYSPRLFMLIWSRRDIVRWASSSA